MKNSLKIVLFISILGISFACNRDEIGDEPVCCSPENMIIPDDPKLGFSVFQYTNLYEIIGWEEGKFSEKLKAETIEVLFDEDEYEYSYYAKNERYPSTNYLVKFIEDQAVDYSTSPAKRYPALSKIVMIPVDNNQQPLKIELADVSKYFTFFYEKANPLEPTKKANEFLLYNRMLGAKGYFENLDDLTSFLTELTNPNKPNIHGRIIWDNNPNSRITPRNEEDNQASAEKNTPIQRIIYDFEQKTVQIEIETNLPADKHRLEWRE